MTEKLYLKDAYAKSAPARVVSHDGQGRVILDRSIFYATGGGQPGDVGFLEWHNRKSEVTATLKGEEDMIVLCLSGQSAPPPVGTEVMQYLNWELRYRHMRVHTALHLLSVVLPLPVTGGQISADKGRLDFLMPEAPEDRDGIEDALNTLISKDYPVSDTWITDAELAAKPEMVKTMSVKPPTGAGHVRLVQIGGEESRIDLQPCGGTHVARTGEIGKMTLGKIQNKGKQNRRVNIHLA